jgi:hypothetical protein
MSRKTVLVFPGQGAYSDLYATAPEYPVELFTEDVELEADLGIDSVKQTELLSRAAERYHLSERPENFRLSEWSTKGSVTDFVFGALRGRCRTVAQVVGRGRAQPGRAHMEQTW